MTSYAAGRGSFRWGGHRLVYEIWGDTGRLLVLLHGVLMDARLNRGVARGLAARGTRVVLLDLLGHGESDKPQDPADYRMDVYCEQVVALLDHLDVDEGVLGGVSLGANVSLLTAVRAPERVRGLVIEAPVLERAVPAAALTFAPALLGLRAAGPLAGVVSRLARRARHTGNDIVDGALAPLALPPAVAVAILQGIMVGPVAPTLEQRRAVKVPALVLGHRRGLIHPFSDARHLAAELPAGRLLPTRTLLELRLRPERLLREIARFLEEDVPRR
jgi:pimeloyl-ACP methyl ester carboxylesterase